MERLDKILAHHGFGSRKICKKLLHSGCITVNGAVCKNPDVQIDLQKDELCVNSQVVQMRMHVYLMMNKPQGVVTSTKDGFHRTVLELLPEQYRLNFMGGNLHPIGRLDIDTEGLLLLTTDGELTHILTSPKNKISKTYFVRLKDEVGFEKQKELSLIFKNGMQVLPEGKEKAFKAQSALIEWKSKSELFITITEGKYHQVKRMFYTVGNQVVFLKRISISSLKLDENLKPGEFKELGERELLLLR